MKIMLTSIFKGVVCLFVCDLVVCGCFSFFFLDGGDGNEGVSRT